MNINDLCCRNIASKIDMPKNIYRIWFSSHLKDLVFKENMGISATRSPEKIMAITEYIHGCTPVITLVPGSAQKINEIIKKAFAGVGKPINDVDWRVSILNLASLNAENKAIRNDEERTNFSVKTDVLHEKFGSDAI